MPLVRLAVDAAVIRLSRKWDSTIYLSWRLVVTLRPGRRRRFATVPVWLNFAHNLSMADLLLFKVLATLKKNKSTKIQDMASVHFKCQTIYSK